MTVRQRLRRKFHGIIWQSAAMENVLQRADQATHSDLPVLLLGETGVGKDLLMATIHHHSARRRGPFLNLNLAAVPPSLMEAELFGYDQGAFTGAVAGKPGLIEQAHGGTLVLNEITETPLAIQAKLLQVVEEKRLRRLGGRHPRRVDFRLMAASNRDVQAQVERGRFRSDLYYRLNALTIRIPPLRERPEDIPPLARHFVPVYARKYQKSVSRIADEALEHLLAYHWPGNVRQLLHVLERAVVFAEDRQMTIGVDDLGEWPTADAGRARATGLVGSDAIRRSSLPILPDIHRLTLEEIKDWVIQERLRQHEGNVSRAAKSLGLSRATLHAWIKKRTTASRK